MERARFKFNKHILVVMCRCAVVVSFLLAAAAPSCALARCGNILCAMCARQYGVPEGFLLIDTRGYGTVLPIPVIDATPPHVVEAMLAAAEVGPGDLLYDPGCGDGRICIAAARRGAQAVGIEIDADRAVMAQQRVDQYGKGGIRIVRGDCLTKKFDAPSVVAMYMTEPLTRAIAAKVPRETRIVSYMHRIPGRLCRKITLPQGGVIYVTVEHELEAKINFPV